jgi:hypothetical protein
VPGPVLTQGAVARTDYLTGAHYGLRGGFQHGLDGRPGVVAGGGRARWPAANEARYFKNKYDHVFTVAPAGTVTWTTRLRYVTDPAPRCGPHPPK